MSCPVVTLTPGPGTIQVNWTNTSASQYIVEVFDNAEGSGSPVRTYTGSGVYAYQFTGLAGETAYWVRVTPANGVDTSPVCNLQQVVTEAEAESLDAPGGIAVQFFGSSVYNTWGAVADAEEYEWQVASSNDFGVLSILASGSGAAAEALINTLTPGDVFYFRVRAKAAGYSDSAWSATTTFGGTQLATPVLSFSSVTENGFTVNWTKDVNSSHRQVEVATDAGFTSIVSSGTGSNSGSFNFSSGSTGVTYYVRVKQTQSDGWYIASEWGTGSQTLP